MGELRLGCIPRLDSVGVVADELLQVCGQRAPVRLEASAGGADALGDVEDDAGEAVLVDVHFLVVGDFAELAVIRVEWSVGIPRRLRVCTVGEAAACVPDICEFLGEIAYESPTEERGVSVGRHGSGGWGVGWMASSIEGDARLDE
jgi:hypothetical protein